MNLGPGESIFYHSHQYDHLIFWPTAGRSSAMQIDDDEEWSSFQDAEKNFAFFKTVGRDGGLTPHRLRNDEDHPVTHYIIELVGPSASETEQEGESNGKGKTNRPHRTLDPADFVDAADHRVVSRDGSS
ncbi:MAG: hypothetical protein ABWX74_18600 [Aeromicrobium sp.]